MVYIAKKNGKAVHHTSLEAMRQIDGIEHYELEMTDAEFEAAGCLVRVIGGKIVVGKTKAEADAEIKAKRKTEIEAELAAIDVRSTRAARSVALAVASGDTPEQFDVSKLDALEAEAKALRAELQGLL